MNKKKSIGKIILRQDMSIGVNQAEEDDKYLFDCFVYYSTVETCQNLDHPGMILLGRTGSGKTAILRNIERSFENSILIDPSELTMNYVSNSEVITFLNTIGANLDHLFQYLWKHVLCIEYIRLRWHVTDERKSKAWYTRMLDSFKTDPRKEKALKYLKDWEGKFWITMDDNIKHLTQKFEDEIRAEFGAELHKAKIRAHYEKQLSTERKNEIIQRIRIIIDKNQLTDLSHVISILSEYDNNDSMKKYYMLIDKLDEDWIDDSVRYRVIKSLIESLKSFRRIRNLKILAALRIDVLEKVIQESKDTSFQREKYEDYYIKIKWKKENLKELINKRIRFLFKNQYTTADICFDDIFTYKVKNTNPFDYIIERTLMRPRDAISFVNECIKTSESKSEITHTDLQKAEKEYSRIRRHSLEDEWRSTFPCLSRIIDYIASFKKDGLILEEITDANKIETLILNILSDEKLNNGPFYKLCNEYFNNEHQKDISIITKEAVVILYRVGVIGCKLHPDERISYSHIDEPNITSALLTDSTRIRIHPMLHATLKLLS